MGSKATEGFFCYLALNNFCACSACNISKFLLTKFQNHDQNETNSKFFYYSPKVAYPWRLYDIKITRIHEKENLTLVLNTSQSFHRRHVKGRNISNCCNTFCLISFVAQSDTLPVPMTVLEANSKVGYTISREGAKKVYKTSLE
jgi:hypothetical protein